MSHIKVLFFSFIITLTFQARANTRPMPTGACPLDHEKLIKEFAQQEFNGLSELGKIQEGDSLNGIEMHRQNINPGNGDTTYEVRPYGKTARDNPIALDGDSGSPESTRTFRCYAKMIVTSDCHVINTPLDFMDNDKLTEAIRDKLIEMEEEAHREGRKLEIDESGRIAVHVAVPKFTQMTCDREPEPQLF